MSANKRIVSAGLIIVFAAVVIYLVFFRQSTPTPISPVNTTDKPSNSQASTQKTSPKKVLFSDSLNGPDRIVTNEFTHYNPGQGCPHTSSSWEMTSGTLLIKNGAGYSGIPTQESNAVCESATHTNSATFRLNTKVSNYKNIKLSLDYKIVKHGGGVANSSYDGIHLWVGYKSEYALYAVSIFRWDNVVVIKKKVPVQTAGCSNVSNDGCYYNLSPTHMQPATSTAGTWHHADLDYSVDASGPVTIVLSIDGSEVDRAVDKSAHGPVYPSGAVGVRGDNTEFYFKNFKVTSLN